MKTLLVAMTAMMLSATDPGRFDYPAPHKSDVVEDHFGHKIADPYRGLEDPNSAETQAWVAAENKVTFDYLATIPERAKIHERLTELWNYERFSPPSKEGPWYIFGKNDGLQNQAVVYKTTSPDAPAEVLIDPNTLSSDGTVALGSRPLHRRREVHGVFAGGQRLGLDRVARARRRDGEGSARRHQVGRSSAAPRG